MGRIDVEALLAPVTPADPCGPNLEYDPAFGELERLTQGKPERQVGDALIPAEPPDWRDVQSRALELLGRSKDLRVALVLVRSLVRTDGYEGLAQGLRLTVGLVERYWDAVHPRLDPDDALDPTIRVNVLGSLCDSEAVLRTLREAPLVVSPALGRLSLRDLAVARGELVPPAGAEPATAAVVEAALRDAPAPSLEATLSAARDARAQAALLEGQVAGRVGPAHAVDLAPLAAVLGEAERVLAGGLAARGVPAPGPAPAVTGAPPGAGASAAAGAGEIRSREDVVRALDQVVAYYRRHEPSSPVPLLVERAQRLVYMDFLDVIRDLAPDALVQVEALRGASARSGEGESTGED